MSESFVQLRKDTAHATLHALSQPLTVMSLALALAQSSSEDAERKAAIDALVGECDRAMRSVQQLRQLIEQGSNREDSPGQRDEVPAGPHPALKGAA